MPSDATDRPFVLLGDVIDSRELDDRTAFGDRLAAALGTVNETYGASILTRFESIKGIDEFGGVLDRLDQVYEIIATMLDRIHPVTVRFGIVQGTVDVGTPGDPITELDGPAFHRAGAILEGLPETGMYVGVDTGRAVDSLLENVLNLLLIEREGLTPRQVEVIRAYERAGTQSAAAASLDIPQQSVSKTLSRANYQRRSTIRRQLQSSLEVLYG